LPNLLCNAHRQDRIGEPKLVIVGEADRPNWTDVPADSTSVAALRVSLSDAQGTDLDGIVDADTATVAAADAQVRIDDGALG
jgi:hypothetical protein